MSSSSEIKSRITILKYIDSIVILYEEIASATNNFADENLITQGKTGVKLYKGQLSQSGQSINIVAGHYPVHSTATINEMIIPFLSNHKNVASVFKISFMRDNEIILINKYVAKGSLNKYLSGSQTLTWMQRLHICVGVAHALSYLHNDIITDGTCVSLIHGNIKSSKILLDDNWEPKLSGFGYSMLGISGDTHMPSEYCDISAYTDPAYIDTKSLSHKSDVFSFGVVLFEVLFGREASSPQPNEGDNWYFVRLARQHHEEETLDDMIDTALRKQMDLQSLNLFSEIAYFCLKEMRSQRPNIDQVVRKLEKALEVQQKHDQSQGENVDHCINPLNITSSSSDNTSMMTYDEYLDSKKIPYEEIASATNNFADKNLIALGKTSVKLYKGELFQSGQLIKIVARLYPAHSYALVNELLISYHSNHKNIASVYKISVNPNDIEGILISKYVANRSLNRYLSDSITLTWMQRLRICVGVAHALSYLHNDIITDGVSFIHGNIKSSKILLDDNWEPKLSGFGYSKRVKTGDIHRPSEYCDISAYTDPAYIDTKRLSHKSDVFSFGVVLFEVLFGREASFAEPNEGDNWYFVRLARQHHEEKTLDDMIHTDLRKQMDLQSLHLFSEIAYFCLKEVVSQRPRMDQVVRKLEKALQLQQKDDQSQVSHLKGENVDHLKIRLRDIQLATQKFSETCEIGSGGFSMVYKADLYHFDGTNSSAIEAKNEGEFPKVLSTVAIKRISRREDLQGEQGFIAEIELLSNCKHPNVASLLGYCDEGPEMILIYEYASNGSLESYLGNPDNLTKLTWAQRLQICIDIAHGLSYLHTSTEEKEMIIHRDIKSANVLLDSNWVAKIANFGLSKLQHGNQLGSTLVSQHVAWTDLYLDPEYNKTGKLKKASDIYSFGVVLFEILCGKLAYDPIYYVNNQWGLPSIVAGQRFNKQRLMKMVDPKIMEADANILKKTGGIDQDSLDTFITIAYSCLAETQAQRPVIEAIIKELEKSLDFQKNSKDYFQMSFKELRLATNNFSEYNCLGVGRFWKLYEGETPGDNGCNTIMVKRWDSKSDPKHHHEFLTEVEVLFKYKHECIIGLAGYCNEMDEKIIVYEHGYNGRLNKHLDDASLTWMKRLKICVDIASGLEFLHSGGLKQRNEITHRDIKSASILLNSDFRAKISNLELCINSWQYEKIEHTSSNHAYSLLGYVDPTAINIYLSKEFDIYSLGVVLIEMLCGRLAWPEGCEDHNQSLGPLATRHYDEEGNLDEMIFEVIKEQIVPQSLTTFQMIALQCLKFKKDKQPSANEVVVQLKTALELQEDIEIWEPKLPRDYKEIIKMSKTPYIYSTKTRKEIYQIFHKGILLQGGKLCFSLSNNEERNEIISASMFTYKNHKLHKWRSVQKSRFQRVVRILNSSYLKIQIKIKPQFLSQNVNYGAYLVFGFCNPRKFSNQPMYVNLKYKLGWEILHAYFATWRDDKWMMIELCQFLHDEKYSDFEVQLDGFSRYYCGSGAIYIEGIEFRAINVANLELFSQSEKNSKKSHMLPAKMILSDSSNGKCFVWNSFPESRFKEVADFLSNQILWIKCQIETQVLSSNTDYACYLIFMLAEKCQGLQCPVKIRENKETKFLYFRTPSALNLHNIKRVPRQRKDGLMEVIVWEFNSKKFNGDHIPMDLKLKCYEGTLCGLNVYGIEFRPI